VSKTKYCCSLKVKTFARPKFVGWVCPGTRRDKHPKKLVCPGGCSLHHKGTENDRTMFFQHVTAGNVKFVVCSESMTNFSPPAQALNFLYETRRYLGNAILNIL